MKYIYTLLLSGLMLLIALPANALTYGGHGNDRDLIGSTRSDVVKHASEHFDRMDANEDGIVEMSELSGKSRKGDSSKYQYILRQLDTNDDNVVSKEEFVARATERFDLADTDKDGKISSAEREESHSIIRAHGMQQVFEAADTNGDGQLSPEEFSNLGVHAGNPQGRGYRRGGRHSE